MVNSDLDIGVKHDFLYASLQPIAVAGGIYVRPAVLFLCDVSETPWENFFKFETTPFWTQERTD